MKKLIILSFLIAFSYAVNAQTSAMSVSGTNHDTISNTGTTNAIIKLTGAYSNVAMQIVVTKVSGTVAGTFKLYGSLDGINYHKIATDTLAMANQTTNSYIWAIGAGKYLYYKASGVGIGTMKGVVKGTFVGYKLQ